MTFDPSNALHFGQGFFLPNLVAIGHFLAIWPLVDPRWPLHDFWPQQCTTLWSEVLFTKFGSHRAFLRQIDPWMTFDLWWGRFESMPTNLVGPSPTPMPTLPINGLHSGLGSFVPIFGGHRAFLRNLTSGWPWLTRVWPLTSAMHYALVMGSSHQIWWP